MLTAGFDVVGVLERLVLIVVQDVGGSKSPTTVIQSEKRTQRWLRSRNE